MCDQLQGRDRGQPRSLIYARLRAMDPLAFEELVIEAFARRGHRVVRSKCYSGVDGEVVMSGERLLLQMKRYHSAVRPEHVHAFANVCAARKVRGLFIHAGRTGNTSRVILSETPHIVIVSGEWLVDLLTGAPFAPRWERPMRRIGA